MMCRTKAPCLLAARVSLVGSLLACAAPTQVAPVAANVTQDRGVNPMNAEPRLAYVVLKVADLDRSLSFYTKAVGMQEIFRYDLGNGVTEVGVGFAPAVDSASGQGLALVHESKRTEPFEHGNAFSRFALAVPDIRASFERLAAAGVEIARAPVAYPQYSATVGFVKDPDGYLIELLQRLPKETE
jgi:lactoylglutathione lyase